VIVWLVAASREVHPACRAERAEVGTKRSPRRLDAGTVLRDGLSDDSGEPSTQGVPILIMGP
jgi:hypothetical protein